MTGPLVVGIEAAPIQALVARVTGDADRRRRDAATTTVPPGHMQKLQTDLPLRQ